MRFESMYNMQVYVNYLSAFSCDRIGEKYTDESALAEAIQEVRIIVFVDISVFVPGSPRQSGGQPPRGRSDAEQPLRN
jgi:hypothetical protein